MEKIPEINGEPIDGSADTEKPWTPSAADVPAWQDTDGEPRPAVADAGAELMPPRDPFEPRPGGEWVTDGKPADSEPIDVEAEEVEIPAPEPEADPGEEPWSKQNEKERKKRLKQEAKNFKQHKWSTRPRRQAAKAAILTLVIGLIVGCVGGILGFNHFASSSRPEAVMEQIVDQHELVTASETVMAEETEVQAGSVFGVDLSFIDSTCLVRYCGEVKVAVDLSTAELVGTTGDTYTIMLDQPYISSNTPDMERSGVIYVQDNALNRIDVTEASRFMTVCKLKVEEEARGNSALFDRARANTEAELARMFKLGTGKECTVNVEWR